MNIKVFLIIIFIIVLFLYINALSCKTITNSDKNEKQNEKIEIQKHTKDENVKETTVNNQVDTNDKIKNQKPEYIHDLINFEDIINSEINNKNPRLNPILERYENPQFFNKLEEFTNKHNMQQRKLITKKSALDHAQAKVKHLVKYIYCRDPNNIGSSECIDIN